MAFLGTGLVTAALVQLALAGGRAQTPPAAPEYQVKAVFVFNFVRFVDWPTSRTTTARSVGICVLGDDPFGRFLDETVRGERLGTREIEVRRYRELSEVEDCDVLFVSRSERERIPQVVSALKNRPVLTVSDDNDFASRGGMIQFVNDKNRVRLRINRAAAETADLTISSQLLRVAEIVGGPRR